MKIIHVLGTAEQETGGPPQVALGICRVLKELGVSSKIVAGSFTHTGEASGIERTMTSDGVTVVRLRARSLPGALKRLTYCPSLIETLEDEAPDLLHIHGLWEYPPIASAGWGVRRRIPYILVPHGMLDLWSLRRGWLKKALLSRIALRWMLASASMVQFLSEGERDEALQSFSIPRTTIIPSGVSYEAFETLPSRSDFGDLYPAVKGKRIILFLGRLHPKKGLELLISAFADVERALPGNVLMLAGPDVVGYRASLEKQATALGIKNSVFFTGHLVGRVKQVVMAAAEAFVLPSFQEGFSVAVLEAMACGVPVVLSPACRFPEVEHFGAGIVLQELSSASIAQALSRLLRNHDERRAMALSGRALIRERYSWANIRPRLFEMYTDAIRLAGRDV